MSNIDHSKKDIISFKNVSKKYQLYKKKSDRLKEAIHPFGKPYHKDFWALKDINLGLKKGEILGIVGKNGAGKSTLLKLISGVLFPTTGEIKVQGKVSALLEVGSGMNSQFTGQENVYFLGNILGYNHDQMEVLENDIRSFAELGEYYFQPVKTYSSGMRSRLGFAISTAIDPDILILDEILSVGDASFRKRAFLRMKKLLDKDSTVIFVSHSAQSIIQICSRAILLDKGQIIDQGKPIDIIRKYTVLIKDSYKETSKEVEIPEETFEELHGKDDNTVELQDGLNILECSLLNDKNEKANILETGKRYSLCLIYKMDSNLFDLFLGANITNNKNIYCSNMHMKNQNISIQHAEEGKTYKVMMNFDCNFLPGDYYLSLGGVARLQPQAEPKKILAIYDRIIFKVVNSHSTSRGLVFLNYKISYETI
ncbi:MAG: ABC transporter ATP-binding protein [Leptospirales bacterium]